MSSYSQTEPSVAGGKEPLSPLRRIISRIIAESAHSRDQGDRYEWLILRYLQAEPQYDQDVAEVDFWRDWEHKGNKPDLGVDLVVRTHDNNYWAVQCKCYGPGNSVSKGDVDSFLSASSQTFKTKEGERQFSRRLLFTTAPLNSNAERIIKDQKDKVDVVGIDELEKSSVDWSRVDFKHLDKALALQPRKQARPHQQEAIKKVIAGFKQADRGQLIMACGTGKTFTSLKLAESYVGKSGHVLFLVPSISLVDQALGEWKANAEDGICAFTVCSDSKVGKSVAEDMSADELIIPPTTDPKKLAETIRGKAKDDKMVVVFSTYHSIDVVAEAQKEYALPEFALTICDEAHRTAGAAVGGSGGGGGGQGRPHPACVPI